MNSGKNVYRVLVVSGTQKGADFIGELADGAVICTREHASNGAEARRKLMENEYHIVIVNTPLGDEFGHELAMAAVEKTGTGVVLLVKNELYEELSCRMEDCGILTVAKPVSKQLFFQSLKLVTASVGICARLTEENRKLRRKLAEQTVVSRAKCLLIEFAHMTEEKAHKYIEKQAMDSRSSKEDIASEIVRTYAQ